MLTGEESNDLHEQAQDLVRLAMVYAELNRELQCSEQDEFCERVGREVYELIVKRAEEKTDELERVRR